MKSRLRGFSLIEIIVVLSIVTLLFGLLGNNFYISKEREALKGASSQLRSFVSYIRQKSVTVVVPDGCSPANFRGYGIFLNNGILQQVYYCPAPYTVVSSLNLAAYAHISLTLGSGSPAVGYFKRETAEFVDASGVKTEISIILSNGFIDKCESITIDEFGLITSNDNVTCP